MRGQFQWRYSFPVRRFPLRSALVSFDPHHLSDPRFLFSSGMPCSSAVVRPLGNPDHSHTGTLPSATQTGAEALHCRTTESPEVAPAQRTGVRVWAA